MKPTLVLASILLLSTVYAQDINQIKWQKSPLSIDGNTVDWGKELRYYEPKTRFWYHLTNDSSYLYMIFQAKDEQLKMALLYGQFSLKLVTHSNPKVKAEIKFLVNPTTMLPPPEGFEPHENPASERVFRDDGQSKQYITKGFCFTNDTLSMQTQHPIEIAKRFDKEQGIVYELKISLNELFGLQHELSKTSLKNIDLEVAINTEGLEMNAHPQGRPGKGGHAEMHGGGLPTGGGMPGGGMPGGGKGGHGGRPEGGRLGEPGGQDATNFKDSFKHKFKLNQGHLSN
jgi:hypothetical protein